jgi:transcriptional regulator with XRE-family HTH domain
VGSQISVGLPFQIRALREQRGWKQSDLAKAAGMLQPRISAMESPGGAKLNLETLRRLASAFDIGLAVRFVPFSELLAWSDNFTPDHFRIRSFEQDVSAKEPQQQSSGQPSQQFAAAAVEGYVGMADQTDVQAALRTANQTNSQADFWAGGMKVSETVGAVLKDFPSLDFGGKPKALSKADFGLIDGGLSGGPIVRNKRRRHTINGRDAA